MDLSLCQLQASRKRLVLGRFCQLKVSEGDLGALRLLVYSDLYVAPLWLEVSLSLCFIRCCSFDETF